MALATDDALHGGTEDAAASRLVNARIRNLLHPAVVGAIFLLHVSLWNVGFLEELELARVWQVEGVNGFFSRLGLVAARPLLLLPSYVGLALSNGGLRGMYIVMGLIVGGQYLATVWAIRPVIESPWARAVLGLTFALHPLWPAGWVLRFLAYQMSALAVVVWAGCTIRFLRGRSDARLVVAGCIVLSVGLFHVQSLMLVPLIILAALACHELTGPLPDLNLRLWWVSFAATLTTVIVNLTYSTIIAPRLSTTSYEGEIIHLSVAGISSASRQLFRTSLANSAFLATYVAVLVASCALLGTAVIHRRHRTFGLLSVLIAALLPLVAVVYAGVVGHTRDPDRVLAPCSIAAVAVGWSVVSRLRSPRLRVASVALALAATIGLSVTARAGWLDRGNENRALLDEVSSAIDVAPPGMRFVVVDSTGDFGDVYSFLPPHLQFAVSEALNREIDVQLCTAEGVTRHHPDAARYPIATTPDCSTVLQPGEGAPILNIDVDGESLTLIATPAGSG